MIGRRLPPSADEQVKPKGFDDFELRLGDLMRGERATLGKSLLDVQRELKIKATYIAAIENADVAVFETPGFIAGYVRSYARYLGLEPDATFSTFCREANFTVAHGMSMAASNPRTIAAKQRKVTEYRDPLGDPNATFVPRGEAFLSKVEPGAAGSVLVLLALIGVIGYGGWSVLQQVQQVQLTPVEQAPGAVPLLGPLVAADPVANADSAAGPVQDGVAAETAQASLESFGRIYRPEALDVPVMISRDGPIGFIPKPPVEPDAVAEAVAAAVAEVQVVAAVAPEVAVFAVRPAWVRVQAADGTVLFEKILDAGERYVLPQTEEPPRLRAGNSGSVYFAVNGETYGPAAPGASVAKNVELSPDALKAKYALADLTQDPDLARMVTVAAADASAPGTEPAE